MAKNIWFVSNIRSGSHDPARCAALVAALSAGGGTVRQVINFPDDPLPDRAAVEAAGIDEVAVFAGDGTINALATALAGWGGALLVLPGGTMNLLARQLHGDADAATIAAAAAGPQRRVAPVPVVEHDGGIALCGVIAGPTTLWGDVREGLRDFDLAAMAKGFGAAWTETFSGAQVQIAGSTESFPAIFIEPGPAGLGVTGFRANRLSDVFGHARAWMAGDFREGPAVSLGHLAEVRLESDGDQIGLMLDGERTDGASPAIFRHGRSPLALVHTKADTAV